jgi:hypothetical protein
VKTAGGVAAALALLGLGACGFFLEGVPERGDSCSFEGTFSLCGQCVSDSCQLDVDACCEDDCGGALELLDRCAGEDDIEACGELKERDGLGSCVEVSCDSACRSVGLASSCTSFGEDCSCDIDGEPNAVLCPPIDDPDIVCCADPGWPGVDLRCECETWGCRDDFDQCYCGPGVEYEAVDCSSFGAYDECCVTGDSCTCGYFGEVCFGEDAYYVDDCGPQSAICGLDRSPVDRCHVDE